MKFTRYGFTIVELAIVIVVIGALATIGIVSYRGAQERAKDAKVRDAADKVVDAIQLFVSAKGHFPKGGWGSTATIGAGTECTDGADGFLGAGTYSCTLEDTLVASGYLPKDFSVGLLANSQVGATSGNATIAVYSANPAARMAIVYYYLGQPSANDTAHFNSEAVKCGYNPVGVFYPRDSLYMKNATCFNY